MACLLQPECNFLHGFFRCKLPVEVVDVEVKVTSMQGMHIFKSGRTTQLIRCMPWTTKLCLHPNIIKKMKTFLEVENKMGPIIPAPVSQFRPPLQKPIPILEKVTPQKKGREPHPRKGSGQPPQGYHSMPSLATSHTKIYQWCISSTCDSKRRYSMAWCRQDVG